MQHPAAASRGAVRCSLASLLSLRRARARGCSLPPRIAGRVSLRAAIIIKAEQRVKSDSDFCSTAFDGAATRRGIGVREWQGGRDRPGSANARHFRRAAFRFYTRRREGRFHRDLRRLCVNARAAFLVRRRQRKARARVKIARPARDSQSSRIIRPSHISRFFREKGVNFNSTLPRSPPRVPAPPPNDPLNVWFIFSRSLEHVGEDEGQLVPRARRGRPGINAFSIRVGLFIYQTHIPPARYVIAT